MIRILLATLVSLVSYQVSQPPRDVPAPASGGCVIRGTVIDKQTGSPLPDYIVHLSGQGMGSVRTDRNGKYEFSGLPPGRYFVDADVPEYRATHLRQRHGDAQPTNFTQIGKSPVQLARGEVREHVDILMWRALAISGRVLDEGGMPLSNFRISIEDLEARPVSLSYGRMPTTDDLGAFRVFGLAPGAYRVCAEPPFGNAGREQTADRVVRTCYPSAVVDADAQPVALRHADVGGVEIRPQRSAAFTISGLVLDEAGQATYPASVSLISTSGHTTTSSIVQAQPGGLFTIYGVTPGEYTVRGEIGARGYSGETDTRDRQVGFLPIRVESDLGGLSIRMARPAKVAGHIAFEEGVPDLRRMAPIAVTVRPDETLSRLWFGPQPSTTVKEDLTFELADLVGARILTANTMSSWTVKSVRYRGVDITDTPTEFKSSTDPRMLEILLTNRAPVLWGHVLNEAGDRVPRSAVILFGVDSRRWKRGVPTTGVNWSLDDGTYRMGRIPAGEYYVVALDPGERLPRLTDPASFELLTKVAEKVVLVEGDERLVDIRTVKLPQ